MLVTGWDYDLNRSNGAGKSSLFQALSWCLYGEIPRDVKVEELVRRGQKACSVSTTFEIDGSKYVVTRRRPSGVDLVVNNEKFKGNPKLIQAVIEQTIGLSYDQFLITSYFPQNEDSSRFLKQNDTKAKDFLSAILNFNRTEAAYKKLQMECKELEVAMSVTKSEMAITQQSIDRFLTLLTVPAPEAPNKDDIVRVKRELDSVTKMTLQVPDTSAFEDKLNRLSAALRNAQQSKYRLTQVQNLISERERKIAHIAESSEHTMECPSCAADLLTLHGKLVEFDDEAAAAVKQSKIDALKAEIDALVLEQKTLTPLSDAVDALQLKLDETKAKRQQARHDYDMALQKKNFLNSQIEGFKTAILANQQGQKQKQKVADQVAALQADLAVKDEKFKKLEEEFMIVSAAKNVMSPVGAIAYSLDSILEDITEAVGQYLDIFSGNTMTYRITSGNDKAKITHAISKDAVDVSVGSLSGGEARGLIISVDLGLADVIARRSGVALPSIMLLDECFEGLDYVGKERVIDALREISKDRCIIVIDHSTEFNALFDKSVKVVKRQQISSLEVS
jgi:DNA repair exonuclease SbcCD ATPase subunit